MTTMTQVLFQDIKVGDTIALATGHEVDRGVALRLEPLFDDDVRRPGPEETVWYFDGMGPLGSWMIAYDIYRVED